MHLKQLALIFTIFISMVVCRKSDTADELYSALEELYLESRAVVQVKYVLTLFHWGIFYRLCIITLVLIATGLHMI